MDDKEYIDYLQGQIPRAFGIGVLVGMGILLIGVCIIF